MSEHVVTVRLYEQVVTLLQREVIEGSLKDGDRLPSENELARRYGVSRTAIREAIKALIEQGVVDVRPGSGTYIADSGGRPLRQGLGWLARIQGNDGDGYLVELRQLMEPGVCALAARRVSGAQLLEMRAALDDADLASLKPEQFVEADVRFHRLIGEASQNPLIGALLDSVGDLLRSQRIRYFTVPGAPEQAQRHHRAILRMLQEHKPVGAHRAMEAHLRQVARDVRGANSG